MGFHPKSQIIVDHIINRCKDNKQVMIPDLIKEIEVDADKLYTIIRKMVQEKLIHRAAVVGAGDMNNNIISLGPLPPLVDGIKDMVPIQVTVKNWIRGEHKRNEFESFFFGGANVQV